MSIVRAHRADAGVAAELVFEYLEKIQDPFEATRIRDEVAAHIDAPDHAFFLAMHGIERAGCIEVHPLSAPHTFEIKRMYVRERYRRRGIGAALLHAAECFAIEHGGHWIYLETRIRLLGALALYEASGYRTVAPYYDGACGDVFLRKEVYRSV